jgi:nitrogen fixation NifU-like protein
MDVGNPRRPASLETLYQELILEHYRRPHNKQGLVDADATATARNTLCGEDITVSVAIDRTGSALRVRDIGFVGQGCSLSQASASMMTDLARGRSPDEIAALTDRLGRLLHGDPTAAADASLGPLRAFSAVSRVPARIPCVLLAWDALGRALTAEARRQGPEQQTVARREIELRPLTPDP